MKIRKITDVKNLKNKRVLVRVDFNVPVKEGKVKDVYKIEKSLPTIKFLLAAGARVILVSHLGRPKGVDKSLSLAPVAKVLEEMLGATVILSEGIPPLATLGRNDKTSIILLENIRFFRVKKKTTLSLPNNWPCWPIFL